MNVLMISLPIYRIELVETTAMDAPKMRLHQVMGVVTEPAV
jgi:hypothetical protein